MTGFPSRGEAERIRQKYPAGIKVRLVRMDDDPHPVPAGTVGEVIAVDDAGDVFTDWSNGSSLAFIPGHDIVEIIG